MGSRKLRNSIRGRATTRYDPAIRIAANTPAELQAARQLEVQVQARYRAGLGTVVEVAEAHRLLRQSETDDSLARLGIWHARLALAAAEGDMNRVIEQGSGR